MDDFGTILRDAISRHHYDGEPMTEAILAGILGVNRSSVHKWSKGAFFPSDHHMLMMSRLFGWGPSHPVWLSLGKIPPDVLDFLCTTPTGRAAYDKLALVYDRYRASVHD